MLVERGARPISVRNFENGIMSGPTTVMSGAFESWNPECCSSWCGDDPGSHSARYQHPNASLVRDPFRRLPTILYSSMALVG